MDSGSYLTTSRRWRRRRWLLLVRSGRILTVAGLLLAAGLLAVELNDSVVQSRLFASIARGAGFQVEAGASPEIWLPHSGPYDTRLGYSGLKEVVPRLTAADFQVTAQSRQSPRFRTLAQSGLYAIYPEKAQAGLALFDRRGEVLYASRYPAYQYALFNAVPPLLVSVLLYVENRDLLDADSPYQNPAVDWGRLTHAIVGQVARVAHVGGQRAGGSTLATQIEKFRHTPGGRTRDAGDKLRQMISASLRAYQGGADTQEARRQIVVDFLNSVPLAGAPGYGEVTGVGEGLRIWYGRDFDAANRLLVDEAADPALRATIFKEALSLIVAERRPSMLTDDRERLEHLTESYLRLLARDGVIAESLRDAALAARLRPIADRPRGEQASFVERKAVNAVRGNLLKLLKAPDLYQLDRLDLDVSTTFDGPSQRAVTAFLGRLGDREFVRCAGLEGYHLIDRGDPAAVRYSFTLYESTGLGNVLRLRADNLDEPLDINAGTKLDLGSSAKFRTLVTYLEVVADLHRRYAGLSTEGRKLVRTRPDDRLTRWALDYLTDRRDSDLAAMLDAAMARRYSGNPGEIFFTGGGIHRFENFKHEDDSKEPTVAEALAESINLAYVRIMRDVVHYYAYEAEDAPARSLREGDEAARAEFLTRFASFEGESFLARFWTKYRDLPPEELLPALTEPLRKTPRRLAAAYLAVVGTKDFAAFADFMKSRLGAGAGDEAQLRRLHHGLARPEFTLADWGYLAHVHPLELWLVRTLRERPEAGYDEILAASEPARVAASEWLFKSRYREAQDKRIKIVVEQAAFDRVAAQWHRLGYPFERVVPSLATAIGSSADRPVALAELMGIVVNGGIRRPDIEISGLHFASGTPFETLLERRAGAGERVLPAEVAAAARQALQGVVSGGTARRVYGVYRGADGDLFPLGGKTGTGDHRYKVVGAGGRLISERVVNRAATFVFFIGDRFYGVVTAFVPGKRAADYGFTSALPVQILRDLEPVLSPLIRGSGRVEAPSCGRNGVVGAAKPVPREKPPAAERPAAL